MKSSKILISFFIVYSSFSFAATTLNAYGFVLPTWIVGSAATESFGQPNLSAYTAAANPVLSNRAELPRSSFQVAQSRVGLLVSPTESVTGRMEFDFIDFSKASPTTASLPRVRRAVVEYQYSPSLMIRAGQDWDLVSPLSPHSYNLVGHYFESGDVAFMRTQLQFVLKVGDLEHAFALGLPGNNNTASDGNLELGLMPTFALREAYHLNPKSQMGLSFLGTSLRNSLNSSDRFFAGVGTAFFETTIANKVEIKTEAYLGENTFNLGLLGLSYRNAATSTYVRDAGAYLTAKALLTDKFSVFGGGGAAWILNPSDMLASYTNTVTGATALGTGPGIERNWTVRLGADYKVADKFVIFTELAALFTRHHLQSADLANYDTNRESYIGQLGTQISF